MKKAESTKRQKAESRKQKAKSKIYLRTLCNSLVPFVLKKTFILLFIFSFPAISQDDCKSALKEYIENMGKISAPEKGKVYFLHLLIQNKYRQETHAAQNIEIKSYITKDLMLFNSTLMQVYSDSSDIFTVIPASRHIFRNETKSNTNAERQQEALTMQLQLIEGSAVISCVTKGNIREIKLRPSEEIEKNKNINDIILQYDLSENKIRKVHIIYTKNSKIAEQIVEYKAMDFNSSYRF